MTQTKGQGQSDITHFKQRDYTEFLRELWFRLAINALRRPHYPRTIIYIDTNAGSGYNEDVGCPGSPLIFLNEAERLHVNYQAYLVEKDPALFGKLGERVKGCNARAICGDNKEVVPDILSRIPKNSLGLIYVDPNGIPDWQMIADASRRAEKLDILIRFNTMALIRNYSNGYLPLPDYLKIINKKCWYGKDYYHSDKWHWSFLLGMNYKFGDWKSKGWRNFDSPDGDDLKDKLTYTKDDLQKKRQLPLTGLMQSTCDIPRLELSERKSSGGLKAFVSGVIAGLLRKYTI